MIVVWGFEFDEPTWACVPLVQREVRFWSISESGVVS